MKVLFLTREYPPSVYGGAGVHVEHLTRELARRLTVEVRCFGSQRESGEALSVTGFPDAPLVLGATPRELRGALTAVATSLAFATGPVDADIVHCHTWYSHLGGIACKLLYGLPLVVTVHSLEPLRPWKREQLGRGYAMSSWVEKQALEMADVVIAVSRQTRDDVLSLFDVDASRVAVIPNGIDVTVYRPDTGDSALERYGIPRNVPYVLFVGRLTRQKGLSHLLRAAELLPAETGLVLCAGDPDTESIASETAAAVAALRERRPHVYWIPEMVPREAAAQLYSHAAVFCCPSVYEPFGIINLEAMASAVAVVAGAVGGIPDIVVDGETGLLVPVSSVPPGASDIEDPEGFSRGLAAALTRLLRDEPLRRRMGRAGRRRAEEVFGWGAVALRTESVYRRALAERQAP